MFKKWIHNMRTWMSRLAHHRFAEPFLGLISFAESSLFPIPVDFLLVPMVLLRPKRWVRFAIEATVFSVLGGLFGYFIGAVLYDTVGIKIVAAFNLEQYVENVQLWFNRGTFFAMLISSFTPIPFKIFTIAGGLFRVDLLPFIIASIIGRGARFAIEAYVVKETRQHMTTEQHPLAYIVLGITIVAAVVVLLFYVL